MAAASSSHDVQWWVAGDWNGFFGLFTNVVLNVIVLTGLCLGVVQLPPDLVFGRILPALGIALPLGNIYYAYLAWQLARQTGRSDVTAMPYGPSVPHMFIVVFLIMLPVYLKTKDPLLAWQSGLAWCLIIGVIVMNFTLIQMAPGSLLDIMTSEQQVTDPATLEQSAHRPRDTDHRRGAGAGVSRKVPRASPSG